MQKHIPNLEPFKRTLNWLSSLFITILLTASFAYVWYNCYYTELVLPFYRKGNWMVIGIYLVIAVIFNQVYGSYKVGYLRKSEAFYSQIISVFVINLITYCQISVIGRDFMNVMPMVLLTIADLIIVLVWTIVSAALYKTFFPPRRMIIVYGSQKAGSLVLKMSRRTDKYIIAESIKADEDIELIKEKMLGYGAVIMYDVPDHMRNVLLKFCFDHSLRVYMAPKISDIIVRGAHEINLFDSPLLLCRNSGLSFEVRATKRIIDFVLALIILPFLLVPMAAVALAIKIEDGGPVIYKQERLTTRGKRFNVLKFRSMKVDAEKDGVAVLAKDHDERITKVGAFIRKCRFDELPQIFNIIKGDMSFVGPRPERPEIAAEYEKEMPEFSFRLIVKAGLTGYAQIMGKYDTTPYDKLRMDLMYIEKYSIMLDFKIMLMTIKTMLFPGDTNESENIIKPKSDDK